MTPPKTVRMPARCWGSQVNDRTRAHLITAELRYDPADPYAVTLVATDVAWSLSRDRLTAGLEHHRGEPPADTGDVWIARECDDVRIHLTSPHGHIALWLRAELVRRFLTRTHAAVPRGTESAHLDWDTGLAQLVSGGNA